jgi:hypothetical protein
MGTIAGDIGTIVEYGDGHVRVRDRQVGDSFVGVGGVTVTVTKQCGTWEVATSDGGAYIAQWHDPSVDGEFSDGVAYVEKYDAGLRTFHGYVDEVSRKIVQTG